MNITKQFLDDVGARSPVAREAMVQAGDKNRIKALLDALISIGACDITFEDIEKLQLPVYKKKYSFSATTLTCVLLDEHTFNRFRRLTDPVALEVAHIRNGVIGLRKDKNDLD